MSTSETETKPPKETDDGNRLGAAEIVDFVLARYQLGRTTNGMMFAIPLDPRAPKVAREIRSLRPTIASAIWGSERKAVGPQAMGAALETLTGLAATANVTKVHLRCAEVRPSVYLDLGDTGGRYVEASRYGWSYSTPHPLAR